MGITKTEVFNLEQNELAEFAKALAHPARIAILQYLIKHQTCICGDLVNVLPLSQSTISQHLKELRRIGIIRGNIEGPKICYCINAKIWQKAQKMIGRIFSSMKCC